MSALDGETQPVPRCVQCDRPAEAEVRPQHRAAKPDRDAPLEPDCELRVVRNAGWIVGASGAQRWYDHAIATMAIELFEAALAQARSGQGDTS